MSARTSDRNASLVPARALLHPLWLTSLALLVLNDHLLKGAALLPAPLTGKLSDFAGLIVAPALLATVLRVRSGRGLAAAHVAVGLLFSAIQLSAAAAQGWSAAMATIGFPWQITRDATDLVALPALLLAFFALRRAMQTPVVSASRRAAEVVAAGTGLVCCAATSPPPNDGDPFVPDLRVDVYLHNAGDRDVVVRSRPLAEGIELDCNAAAQDPGRLLTSDLFGESTSFRLEPDQNFGLRLDVQVWDGGWDGGWDTDGEPAGEFMGDCYAYLIDVDGMPPAVVFWQEGSIPEHVISGEGYEPEDEARGGIDIVVSEDPDLFGRYEEMGDEIVFLVPPAMPPVDGACAAQSDADRLDWSEPVPLGTWELVDIDRGADGCFALDLGVRDFDGMLYDQDRWYLCTPQGDLGLEPGRLIRLGMLGGGAFGEGGVTLETTEDAAEGLSTVELWAYRGDIFPEFRGVSVAAVPDFECGYVVGESCGTITRATSVTVGGGAFGAATLEPGEQQTLMGDGGAMSIAVAHAEERAGLDPECAAGPDTLGLDLEVAALFIQPAG